MKDNPRSFHQSNITGNDTVAVRLLREAYEKMVVLSEKHPTEFNSTISQIEQTYTDNSKRDDLRMRIVLEEAQELLETDNISPTQRKNMFDLLEKIIFLRESEDDISIFFDRLNENIHSLLRLDFDNNITFPSADTGASNLLDLVSGSLMLIKEKYEQAVVSNKAINKITSITPEQLVIITDLNGKIRFIDGNTEKFLQTSITDCIHTNITEQFPELNEYKGVIGGIELSDFDIKLQDARGLNHDYKLVVKNTLHEAEQEDEIVELAFLFSKSKADNAFKSSIAREYHDRLAPINTIISAAEILKDICVYHEEAKGCSEIIFNNAINLKKETARKLSELSGDKNTNELEVINFEKTIQQILKSLEHNDGRDQIEITYELEDLEDFTSNPKHIYSILFNLLSNAIKYSKKSATEATNSYVKLMINHATHIDGVLILVEDNGRGISASDKKSIFTNNYQSDSKEERYGIGLKLIYDLVQELNGVIEVESMLDFGTTFIIQLPTSKV